MTSGDISGKAVSSAWDNRNWNDICIIYFGTAKKKTFKEIKKLNTVIKYG